jgi:hypothetical protein
LAVIVDYWIEVTSGSRWERLLKTRVALEAPNTTRYQNFFKGLKPGDIMLHYLTMALTLPKERRSTIVAVSKVASKPEVLEKKIVAECKNTKVLPKPIPFSKLQEIKGRSGEFNKLLRMGMQRYLTRISQSDFESVLSVYPANRKRFLK